MWSRSLSAGDTAFRERPFPILDRMADEADYAVIGPVDGRTEVRDARQHPYHALCQLDRDFGEGLKGSCSGFLIAPQIVLTAGHCLYSQVRQKLGMPAVPRRIRLVFGRTSQQPNGVAQVWAEHWYAAKRFVRARDAFSDFGIIVLSKPVPDETVQPLVPRACTDGQLAQIRARRLLRAAGYPGDKPAGSMWEHAERLDRYDAQSLFYSIDTCPGHSGSAVWAVRAPGGCPEAVAIHVAGPGGAGCRPGVPMAPKGAFNRGTRLTPLILQAAQDALRRRVNTHILQLR